MMGTYPEHSCRLVVVSNRGPYSLRSTNQGITYERTIGGLVTSLLPMMEQQGGIWIAWGDPPGHYSICPDSPKFDLRYIDLTAEQVDGYYYGFANNALWPLCHYFLGRVHYDDTEWRIYQQVNARFATAILHEAQESDLVWVHDYHLALVPRYLRRDLPRVPLAFFWHIPFPAAELFRTLPWRRPFLESLLSCDLVGFHISEYAENFAETAVEVLGARCEGESIEYKEHVTRVLARPIGIDYEVVHRAAGSRRTEERVRRLRQALDSHKLILGVERMDYTKGVPERLQAVERLLERRPDLHRKLHLIQIVTPSRSGLDAYRQIKREIDEIVGRINGRFSDGYWTPVRYMCRSVSPAELIAYYRAADIALVTPLRDGLNLVAKEYVASRIAEDGVLILSEFAGVAHQLPEALLVNPYSTDDMVAALEHAFEMPEEEQQRRMRCMQSQVKAQDIFWWAQEFLDRMIDRLPVRYRGALEPVEI